jgi:hypothetical protein
MFPLESKIKSAIDLSPEEYRVLTAMARECGLLRCDLASTAIARGLPLISGGEKLTAYKVRRREALNLRRKFNPDLDERDLEPSTTEAENAHTS